MGVHVMEMVSYSVMIPKEMVPYLDAADQEQAFRRNAMLLYPLIQNATMSHGRAAEILGIHKLDLIEFYNTMGLPYLNQDKDELLREINDYSQFKESRG